MTRRASDKTSSSAEKAEDGRAFEAEFSRRFWAAREEHRKEQRAGEAHSEALAFSRQHGRGWVEGLLEASRLDKSDEPDEALAVLERCDDSIPEEARGLLHFLRGSALYTKGDFDGAIAAFRRGLETPAYETAGPAWNNLGFSLQAKGDLEEAIAAYGRALESTGYDSGGSTWNNLGVALQARGDLDEAIAAYRRALESTGYNRAGSTWNNLGVALQARGDLDEAIAAYQEAVASPGFERPGAAWYNLGVVLQAKGELEEAITAYRRALDSPDFANPGAAWNNLGNVLQAKGNLDEAIAAFRRALECSYDSPRYAWNNLGTALEAKGDQDEAIAAYRRAVESPGYDTAAKAWANLGNLYLERDELAAARESFQEALECSQEGHPDRRRARLGLRMVESRMEPEELTPDDRAFIARPAIETQVGSIEARLIDKIQQAGETQYDRYVSKGDSERGDSLSVLRGWSSAVTLLEGSERLWRGGGYFLKWREFGVVLDPGIDFLRNFHDSGFHGREISAVIVSHNHSDHNEDLKAIDDLRYELHKRCAGKKGAELDPYVLVWDQDTAQATQFATQKPAHQLEPIIMPSGLPQPIDLSTHRRTRVPLRLIPFKVRHSSDVPSAMGMTLELLNDEGDVALRIGYTADTGYFEELPDHLEGCDALIAHISQPSIEELQDASKRKKHHLGYRGMARLLEECRPKLALVGEFWAGYADLRIDLTRGLRQRTRCDHVLPAGLGMHLELPSLSIECTECGRSTSYEEIRVAPPTDTFGDLAYLCPDCLLH